MSKTKQTKSKLLTPEEVSKFRAPDPAQDIKDVMGFGLASAFKLATEGGKSEDRAVIATRTNPDSDFARVDKLPEPIK